MSSEYTPSATYHAGITRPSDGDFRNAASINAAVEDLADNIAWLYARAGLSLYDIKAYGALGNGTDDDYDAIQDANAAAQAAGGGILLVPPGDFRITNTISLGDKVSLLGFGPHASSLILDDAADTALQIAGTAWYQGGLFVRDLSIKLAQNTSEELVYLATDVAVTFQNVYFGSAAFSAASLVKVAAAASGNVKLFRDCVFDVKGSGQGAIDASLSPGGLSVLGGRIFLPSTYNSNAISLVSGSVRGMRFDNTAITTSTGFSDILSLSNAIGEQVLVDACTFTAVGGAVAGETRAITGTDGGNLVIGPCSLGSAMLVVPGKQAPGSEGGYLGRALRHQTITSSSTATVTINPNRYGTITLSRTTDDDFTLAADAEPYAAGLRFSLTVRNTTGTDIDALVGGAYFDTVTPTEAPWSFATAVIAGASTFLDFVSVQRADGTNVWVLVSAARGGAM